MLENGTVRFSRPTLFNDLFDTTLEMVADIHPDSLVTRALEEIFEKIFSNEIPEFHGTMGVVLKQMWAKRDVLPSKEHLKREIRLGLEETLERIPELAGKFGNEIAGNLEKLKIFCMTNDPASAPMWGNYADNLTGGVLGFSPTPGLDSYFKLAKPITYSDQRPTLMTYERVKGLITGNEVLDPKAISHSAIHTKKVGWSYEKEWRITAGEGWAPESDVEYIDFSPADLREIILGTRFDEEQLDTIEKCLLKYPNAKLFKLSKIYEIVPV